MRRDLVVEGAIVTAILVACTRLLILLPFPVFLGSVAPIFAILCVYLPLLVLWVRRRSMPLTERDGRMLGRGLLWFGGSAAVVFPLFALAAAGWQTWIMGERFTGPAAWPSVPIVVSQLFFAGFPEEFFFRGYLQPTLESASPRRWRILGADVGWGWIGTSAIFALAHSVIHFQWWHFAIFFPALLFGYLRARTGGILAPILFHTTANLVMDWIARSYSV